MPTTPEKPPPGLLFPMKPKSRLNLDLSVNEAERSRSKRAKKKSMTESKLIYIDNVELEYVVI